MTKIISLDFDGPLTNFRTMMQSGDNRAFDPVAINTLNHLCAATAAKIVCTSVRTWTDSEPNFRENMALFEEAGLDIRHLHPDWSCRTDQGKRENHIQKWLTDHPTTKEYVIIDDDMIDLPNFVRIDQMNGILLAHWEAVAKCLDIDIGDVFKEAAHKKYNIVEAQMTLPFPDNRFQ
jgi:hypothetical protein